MALVPWLLPLFAVSVASASQCSLPTLFVDLHERLVDGRSDFFQYGLFVGAGSPSQNNSLWPAVTHNETHFASPDFCSGSTVDHCNNFTHGHFGGGDASQTWKETPQYNSLDVEHTVGDTTATYGRDTLNVWTHYFDPSPAYLTPLKDFPVTLLSNYTSDLNPFFNAGTLGLGPDSTVLNGLFDRGIIRSHSYGLYLGTRYPRAGGWVNGSVTFGGYDAGHFVGDVHRFDLASVPVAGSPFKLRISQMSLITSDGNSVALITDEGFDGYLSTSQYPLRLPSSLTQKLAGALGATPANNPENTLRLNKPFDGNLTITIGDNLTVTYPSEWIANVSDITPFSAAPLSTTDNSSSSDEGPFVLGAAFLHHLYMVVDYDTTPGALFLAEAKLFDNYVQPRPLCPGAVPAAMTPPQISTFARQGMIGAIIGGVIGGSALALGAWFLFRRYARGWLAQRRTKKASKAKAKALDLEADEHESRPTRKERIVQFLTPTTPKDNRQVQFSKLESGPKVGFSDTGSLSSYGRADSFASTQASARSEEAVDIEMDRLSNGSEKGCKQVTVAITPVSRTMTPPPEPVHEKDQLLTSAAPPKKKKAVGLSVRTNFSDTVTNIPSRPVQNPYEHDASVYVPPPPPPNPPPVASSQEQTYYPPPPHQQPYQYPTPNSFAGLGSESTGSTTSSQKKKMFPPPR